MAIIPSPNLGRGTYIDENALQPGQVRDYFGALRSKIIMSCIGHDVLELGRRAQCRPLS